MPDDSWFYGGVNQTKFSCPKLALKLYDPFKNGQKSAFSDENEKWF